jgi:hypothetical protein
MASDLTFFQLQSPPAVLSIRRALLKAIDTSIDSKNLLCQNRKLANITTLATTFIGIFIPFYFPL